MEFVDRLKVLLRKLTGQKKIYRVEINSDGVTWQEAIRIANELRKSGYTCFVVISTTETPHVILAAQQEKEYSYAHAN